ncbi:hypothetical protein [Sphingomonas sp.]|jgi:hypothetical protein|uniref:hypothetical protein n=1 Tax=Sphingomonas sp. TaxID=28214 RepID=UPI003566C10E
MTNAKPAKRKIKAVDKAVDTVRDAASTAIAATTSTTRAVTHKAVAGIEANPMAVLGGGIALGVLVGAFVPRSAVERKMLKSVGKRLNDTAQGAIDAARDTAKAEFDVLGLSRDAARDQVGKMLGGVVKALATAGTAALAARTVVDQAQAEQAPPASAPAPAPRKRKKPVSTE